MAPGSGSEAGDQASVSTEVHDNQPIPLFAQVAQQEGVLTNTSSMHQVGALGAERRIGVAEGDELTVERVRLRVLFAPR